MKEIRLSRGMFAIVADEDFERVAKLTWHAHWNIGAKRWEASHSIGYAKENGKRGCRSLSMAHFILGKPPKGMEVDHRNGDQLDNCRSNLRFCTKQQNMWNRRKNSNSTLKYKGIKRRIGGTFQARIVINGKRVSLGSAFLTQEDAALAYNDAARIHFGEFARLNEIQLAEEAA